MNLPSQLLLEHLQQKNKNLNNIFGIRNVSSIINYKTQGKNE